MPRAAIHKSLLSSMGSADSEQPQYQVGEGCLADQLIGQYLAEVAGLGAVVNPAHARTTLESIFKYNFKRAPRRARRPAAHLRRSTTKPALIVCDYGKGERPAVPFPYYAEAWTGMEYSSAATMIYAGLVREGLECVESARARYDGERRNPWNEPECGHHYARAMSAWSAVLALSGFRYHGGTRHVAVVAAAAVAAVPERLGHGHRLGRVRVRTGDAARSRCACCTGRSPAARSRSRRARAARRPSGSATAASPFRAEREDHGLTLRFDDELRLAAGQALTVG